MQVRKATMRDIPALLELINDYAADGIMLPRSEFEMAESIRDFTVLEAGKTLTGCGALHFYTPTAAEIRSVAVNASTQGRGIGRKLVEALEAEAQASGMESIFAFTYVSKFFSKMGYLEVDRSELPLKAWRDCMRCPKFQACDELAMVKYLHGRDLAVEAHRREVDAERIEPEAMLVTLPVLRK